MELDLSDTAALITAVFAVVIGIFSLLKSFRVDKHAAEKEDMLNNLQLSVSSVDGWKNLTNFLQNTVSQNSQVMNQMRLEMESLKSEHVKCEESRIRQSKEIHTLQNSYRELQGLYEILQNQINKPN